MQQTIGSNKHHRDTVRQNELNLHRHNLMLQEKFAQKRDADIEKHHKDIYDKDMKIYNTFIVSEIKRFLLSCSRRSL